MAASNRTTPTNPGLLNTPMLDTTLPFPYQSDQQLADWQESQSSDNDRFDDNGYCQSFLSTCTAEGMAPTWAINQIFAEHGSEFQEFIKHTPEAQWLDGRAILNWLGY